MNKTQATVGTKLANIKSSKKDLAAQRVVITENTWTRRFVQGTVAYMVTVEMPGHGWALGEFDLNAVKACLKIGTTCEPLPFTGILGDAYETCKQHTYNLRNLPKVSGFRSGDLARAQLASVAVWRDDSMAATDGHRVTYVGDLRRVVGEGELPRLLSADDSDVDGNPLLIPSEVVDVLCRFGCELAYTHSTSESGGINVLDNGRVSVSWADPELRYPDVFVCMRPEKVWCEIYLHAAEKKQVIEACKNAEIAAKAAKSRVDGVKLLYNVGNRDLVVTSLRPGCEGETWRYGTTTAANIRAKWLSETAGVTVGVSAKYLREALEACEGGAKISWSGELDPIHVSQGDTYNVTMPMRI